MSDHSKSDGTRHRVRMTDEFLRSVADSWLWHRLQGRRDPAVVIAEESGPYERRRRSGVGQPDDAAKTAAGWIDAARRKGLLPCRRAGDCAVDDSWRPVESALASPFQTTASAVRGRVAQLVRALP